MLHNPNAPEFALTKSDLLGCGYMTILVVHPAGSRRRIVFEDAMLSVMTTSDIENFERRCGIIPASNGTWAKAYAIDAESITSKKLLAYAQEQGDKTLVDEISAYWLNRLDSYVMSRVR